MKRMGGGWVVTGSARTLRAKDVLLATNGYTGAAMPALGRRVVPVGSYLIATAPLDAVAGGAADPAPAGAERYQEPALLLPALAGPPDGLRGPGSVTPTPVARSAEILARGMVEVFPELADTPGRVRVGRAGGVRARSDAARGRLDAGRLDGAHYALGYGGHGVAMATWLGARMGEALAGRASRCRGSRRRSVRCRSIGGRRGFCRSLAGIIGSRTLFERRRGRRRRRGAERDEP